ncbi:MAG: amidohydrolase, partial [Myxococcota bacterium]
LRRISHAAWVNGAVLELAGIGPETVAPEGGEILREPSGAPTGILVDKARDLARPFLPAPTDEQLRGDLARGLGALRDLGLTQTHTMDLPVQALDVLLAMEAAGQVPIRVFVYVGDAWPELERFLQRPLDTQGLVQVVGVKLYADGALGSRSAALLEPYSDGGDTKGLLFQSTQSLAEKVGAVHRAGYQLAIHAIGDAANRQVLDVLTPIASAASRRPRVEHAQILEPSDIQRFAASGIVASVQPIHATSDMGWAVDRIGEERLVGAYAWRSLIDSGATVVFGSDFPVESANPWLGIHAAVTRENIRGEPKDGFIPDQKLTVQQALERFTTAAWEVAGRRGGQLSPGLPADVSIVDRDPFTVAPSELKDIKALRVFVAGR